MLDLYNARLLWKWGAALTAMLSLCERGIIVGTPNEQTAYIHRQFAEGYGVN